MTALIGTETPELPRSMAVRRNWTLIAAAILSIGAGLNIYLAGLEYAWWEGASPCLYDARSISELMNSEDVTCNTGRWSILGIPETVVNAVISSGCVISILLLTLMGRGVRASGTRMGARDNGCQSGI